MPQMTLHPLGTPNAPDAPIPLLVPGYLESLLALNTPLTPQTAPTPLRSPQMAPDAHYTPSGAWVPRVPASPNTPLIPPNGPTPIGVPQCPWFPIPLLVPST